MGFKVAKEGFTSIIIFIIVTLLLFLLNYTLGIIGLVLTVWCVMFFRDPNRVSTQNTSLVIAPADGRIIKVEVVSPPQELGFSEDMLKISIFMNVFNVHVNRSPMIGVIEKIIYYPGLFVNAALDKASTHNERQSFIMNVANNKKIAFVQISGLVARRIIKYVNEGQNLEAGERIGLIKFGSRVDVYLPKETKPFVAVGQTSIAGETILADLEFDGMVNEFKTIDKA
jgi:phosphatidylserine decarboxylase